MTQSDRRLDLRRRILSLRSTNFSELTLLIFYYQAEFNPIYKKFLDLLNINPLTVKSIHQIPFMPISFFKTHKIKTGVWKEELLFSSSGTSGSTTSSHYVKDVQWYTDICKLCFQNAYGDPEEFCFLALLPAYLEREGSSLVFMADQFIKDSKFKESGFFLNNIDDLILGLNNCKKEERPTVLLGVSFALMDLAEKYVLDLSGIIVMETGGMKGRRQEITRSELHKKLISSFGISKIHSEYGMTEMMSQCYSKGDGIFRAGPTVKLLCREINDPFARVVSGRPGLIDIIDLANLDTCSFLSTDDLGKVHHDGSFEITGRLDASDIRGCNLLIDTY